MDKMFPIHQDGDISPVFSFSMQTLSVTLSYVRRVSTLCEVIGYMRNYLHVMNLKWSDHKIVEYLKSDSDSDYHTSLDNGDKTLLISYEGGLYSFHLSQSIEVLNPYFF